MGTSVGGIPELLRGEELVPPNDPEALAAKIQEVLSDSERMKMLSQRNLDLAGQFTESTFASGDWSFTSTSEKVQPSGCKADVRPTKLVQSRAAVKA